MKKFSKEDQKLMATWALDCAERVLSLFEEIAPHDERPRKAIETGRKWVEDGIFSMPVIRGASLSAHASAKEVDQKSPACFAAHAAGQAVATAHVPQHAYGGAYYALKAIAANNPDNALTKVYEEFAWQSQHLPEHLRAEMLPRIIIEERKTGPFITVQKGPDF